MTSPFESKPDANAGPPIRRLSTTVPFSMIPTVALLSRIGTAPVYGPERGG